MHSMCERNDGSYDAFIVYGMSQKIEVLMRRKHTKKKRGWIVLEWAAVNTHIYAAVVVVAHSLQLHSIRRYVVGDSDIIHTPHTGE